MYRCLSYSCRPKIYKFHSGVRENSSSDSSCYSLRVTRAVRGAVTVPRRLTAT